MLKLITPFHEITKMKIEFQIVAPYQMSGEYLESHYFDFQLFFHQLCRRVWWKNEKKTLSDILDISPGLVHWFSPFFKGRERISKRSGLSVFWGAHRSSHKLRK